MKFEPRPYQTEDINYALDHDNDIRPIHCAPTGSGKTVIQAFIAKRELDRGNRTAILTPREEIFNQTHSILNQVVGAENVATLRAGHEWNSYKPVHIVSWPTLTTRSKKSDFWYPRVERVLVDECHLSMAPRISEILDHYELQGAVIDGYTATPARKSGKGLGRYFTEIKHVRSVRQLIKDGWLAPLEYWGGATPDVEGLKVARGDYEVRRLSERSVLLVGDVIDQWLRLASGRHTLVFGVDIAHAEALCERFQKAHVNAAVIHNRKSAEERLDIVNRFKSLDIQVLCNVTIASYGFDCPEISCIVAARPTCSTVLWLQSLGRGMRVADGKTECMVLDHAGNTEKLGFADNLYRWRLAQGKKAVANWTRSEQGEKEQHVHTCKACNNIFEGSRVCPKCGWKVPFQKRDVASTDEDLVPIGHNMGKRLPAGWPEHKEFYRMLICYGYGKKYKPGWAPNQFKKKVGCWPENNWMNLPRLLPEPRVLSYIIKEQQNYVRRLSYAQRAERKKRATA